jgi:hypothetical protein
VFAKWLERSDLNGSLLAGMASHLALYWPALRTTQSVRVPVKVASTGVIIDAHLTRKGGKKVNQTALERTAASFGNSLGA